MSSPPRDTLPLPSPRQLLTSLVTAISAIPLDSERTPLPSGPTSTTPTTNNPLRLVPAPDRPLLVTLHVLFPAQLLPALDLLDQGLVARLVVASGPPAAPAQAVSPTTRAGGFFLVRSTAQAAAARGRRFRAGGRGGGGGAEGRGGGAAGREGPTGYVVRVDAWNCTCAAFAIAAFAGGTTTTTTGAERGGEGGEEGNGEGRGAARVKGKGQTRTNDIGLTQREGGREEGMDSQNRGATAAAAAAAEEEEEEEEEEDADETAAWSFGGLSLDGTEDSVSETEAVPVCKHLLACLLAERWKAALGRYVVERRVRKEEMAGLVADL
ncbi:hypothetical protein P8C59_004376 [Phyllachora maydis]|uniref:Uncharacterized protein n=1 Tax=Phyllachora maydis TaxID=1825666 RepID=A0AAD9I252_9PEZI|nr:hypothetical protein P8C59_004376 [Phyllachora maydis]